MKKISKMIIIVVIIALFSLTAEASEVSDDYLSDFEDILPEDVSFGSLDGEDVISSLGIESLLALVMGEVSGRSGEVVSFFLLLVGSLAFLAVAESMSDKLSSVASAAVGIAVASVLFSRIAPLFTEVLTSLGQISSFFISLSPLMASITLSGGGAGAAAVQSVGAGVIISFVQFFTGDLFLSLASLSLAMSALSAFGEGGVMSIVGGIKNIFLWVMGIVTAVLAASLSLQTLVASSSDSAGMRAAKYAASGMIPIVGSSISGALSTLASGLSYVKGVVGGVSVFVIVGYFLAPLIMLLLYRLALSISLSLGEFVGAGVAKKIFTSFRFSLDALIAVYAISALLYIFQIILFVKSGVALS